MECLYTSIHTVQCQEDRLEKLSVSVYQMVITFLCTPLSHHCWFWCLSAYGYPFLPFYGIYSLRRWGIPFMVRIQARGHQCSVMESNYTDWWLQVLVLFAGLGCQYRCFIWTLWACWVFVILSISFWDGEYSFLRGGGGYGTVRSLGLVQLLDWCSDRVWL